MISSIAPLRNITGVVGGILVMLLSLCDDECRPQTGRGTQHLRHLSLTKNFNFAREGINTGNIFGFEMVSEPKGHNQARTIERKVFSTINP